MLETKISCNILFINNRKEWLMQDASFHVYIHEIMCDNAGDKDAGDCGGGVRGVLAPLPDLPGGGHAPPAHQPVSGSFFICM